MKRLTTLFVLLLISGFIFGQGMVKGKVVDQNGEALIGASVLVQGTNIGTITDVNGDFAMKNLKKGATVFVVSYLGFETTPFNVNVSDNTILPNFVLQRSSVSLDEIVVTGVMDIVKDRRTPVAVSTIPTSVIQAKGGNVEFPELLKNTPSIYVANQAGGYGDSEVFTRGFDQTNTAFLLNGQPINGMEDGKLYWSNWSGMTDIASAIQIQRGLGSSKLAISSVGGTVNIVMKATEKEQGGSASFLYGNDNYLKGTVAYNTGMINNKFGVSMLLTHWQGDGWAEGTKGQGQNYFLSFGYKPNAKNTVNFLITGAPQWHDQNYTKKLSSYYNSDGELNVKYNSNWGYVDGEYLSERRNYYHKPVANLNWDWYINEKSKLSTVLYASWGVGGGTGGYGAYAKTTTDGYKDWDATIAYNESITDGIGSNNTNGSGYVGTAIRGSRNNHSWYGLVTKYDSKLTQHLSYSVGADLRTYKGKHFRELTNLLGLSGFDESDNARYGSNHIVTETYYASPWKSMFNSASLDQQIDYSYSERISYEGLFGQLEYVMNNFSTFVQGSVSSQQHQRFEYWNETEANEASEKVTNPGFNVKGGASYTVNEQHTFFGNIGYYHRQPFHDDVYLNYSNLVNPVTVPEKIFGAELGYKFVSEKFALNFNAYRTEWNDRSTTTFLSDGTELSNGYVIVGEGYKNAIQDELHSGLELDFGYDVLSNLKLKGYGSLGNWIYTGTLDSKYYNADKELVLEESGTDVEGVKVGGAAQTSVGLGVDYKALKDLSFSADYNYYDRLYSNISAGSTSMELPAFGLLDLGVAYNFHLTNKNVLTLRANMYNVLGTEYISKATTAIEASTVESENWNGVNKKNKVTFGTTRTWNVSAKISF